MFIVLSEGGVAVGVFFIHSGMIELRASFMKVNRIVSDGLCGFMRAVQMHSSLMITMVLVAVDGIAEAK